MTDELTDDQLATIRELAADRASNLKIARALGLTKARFLAILRADRRAQEAHTAGREEMGRRFARGEV